MLTKEIDNTLLGKRVKGIFTSLVITGVVTKIISYKYSKGVGIKMDVPIQWCGEEYIYYESTYRIYDDFGNLQNTEFL